jgi:hypothetical protein
MKNADQPNSFPKFPIPTADPAARERTLHRALIAFRHPAGESLPAAPTGLRLWLALPALALLLLGVFFGVHLGQRGHYDAAAALAQALQEIETLFPRQVNAIVENQGEIQIDLASTADTHTEQPVYVELRRGPHSVRIISYSGRSVTVSLGEEAVTIEPLITGNGKVILVGDDFVWPGAETSFQAEVRPLLAS